MADLDLNLQDLATAIATNAKATRTLINGNAADLSALTTVQKSNLVAAINEVAAAVGGAGASIDDNTTSALSVWSSAKTDSEIDAAVAALLDSAPGALDTLNELAAALGDDPNFATTITTALAGKAATTHTHTAADVTGGTFDAARLPGATEAGAGIVELATAAEVVAGTDTARAVTPAGLFAAIGNTDTDYVAIFQAGLA